MKYDDIAMEWGNDSVIPTDLNEVSYKIPLMHHKYFTMLNKERLILKRYMLDEKALKTLKYEYYQGSLDEQTLNDNGWDQWEKTTLKSEIPMYIDGDSDIIKLKLKIAASEEKVELLESIIRMIHNMNWNVKNIIDWTKFQNGEM